MYPHDERSHMTCTQANAKIVEAMDAGDNPDERLQSAVAAGLNEARQKALAGPTGTAESSTEDDAVQSSAEPKLHQPEQQSHSGADGREVMGPGAERADAAGTTSSEQQKDLVQSGNRDR